MLNVCCMTQIVPNITPNSAARTLQSQSFCYNPVLGRVVNHYSYNPWLKPPITLNAGSSCVVRCCSPCARMCHSCGREDEEAMRPRLRPARMADARALRCSPCGLHIRRDAMVQGLEGEGSSAPEREAGPIQCRGGDDDDDVRHGHGDPVLEMHLVWEVHVVRCIPCDQSGGSGRASASHAGGRETREEDPSRPPCYLSRAPGGAWLVMQTARE